MVCCVYFLSAFPPSFASTHYPTLQKSTPPHFAFRLVHWRLRALAGAALLPVALLLPEAARPPAAPLLLVAVRPRAAPRHAVMHPSSVISTLSLTVGSTAPSPAPSSKSIMPASRGCGSVWDASNGSMLSASTLRHCVATTLTCLMRRLPKSTLCQIARMWRPRPKTVRLSHFRHVTPLHTLF